MNLQEFATPFRCVVVDDLIPANLRQAAFDAVPPQSWTGWVDYRNELEQKRTTKGITGLGEPLRTFFDYLVSWPWLAFLERLTGITGLIADPTHYGSGLHVSDPGDYLGCHIDFALCPRTGLERRVNLIVFLNPEWKPEWGGETQMWDRTARQVERSILPAPGRCVIWIADDDSYHGAAKVTGPQSRVTAACYYYTEARLPAASRQRAMFIPQR